VDAKLNLLATEEKSFHARLRKSTAGGFLPKKESIAAKIGAVTKIAL
jgi:hypothetical protein